MVMNTLSIKSTGVIAYLRGRYLPVMIELRKLRIGLDTDNQKALLANFQVRSVLVERIPAAQFQDPLICTLRVEVGYMILIMKF